MDLKSSPTKNAKKTEELRPVDDKEKYLPPKSVADEDEIEDYRRRFVGEIDLPEGVCSTRLSRVSH